MKYCIFTSVKKKCISCILNCMCCTVLQVAKYTHEELYALINVQLEDVCADLLLCKELAGLLILMSFIHYAELMDVHGTTQQAGVGITMNDNLSEKTV